MSFTQLDKEFWADIFEESVNFKYSYELNGTCAVDLERTGPVCSKCEKPLEIPDSHTGSADPVVCGECGEPNNSFPAPEWMQEYTVNDLRPRQIYRGENAIEIDETGNIKPIAVQCVSCSSVLSISSETPRNCTCEHCGTVQYLPDPLWFALHPVKKRKHWYIRFA